MSRPIHHPVFARLYANRRLGPDAAHADRDHRKELLAGLRGRVLEIGCGDGRNFEHYPPEVTEVVGIEPEPYLLERAQEAVRTVPVRLIHGQAEDLGRLALLAFDAAVFSLVLCSVKNPEAILRNTKKVLKDGAAVRFYEHVVSLEPGLATWQHALSPLWSLVAGGCVADRDLISLIKREFLIANTHQFDFRPNLSAFLVKPHIIMSGLHRDTV